MAAGGHIMLTGDQPVQNVEDRTLRKLVRHPIIFLYELEGNQKGAPDLNNLIGDQSFAYKELCLETLEFAYGPNTRVRGPAGGVNALYCPTINIRHLANDVSRRDETMRRGIPIDANFPPISLRPEVAASGKFYEPSAQGLDAEVYNPAYFRNGGACTYVPSSPRPCFQPIYGLGCNATSSVIYDQPVAFFTSAFADRVANVAGAVGARSVVFGFSPVMFNPAEIKPAFEYILFQEWKLPVKPTTAVSASSR